MSRMSLAQRLKIQSEHERLSKKFRGVRRMDVATRVLAAQEGYTNFGDSGFAKRDPIELEGDYLELCPDNPSDHEPVSYDDPETNLIRREELQRRYRTDPVFRASVRASLQMDEQEASSAFAERMNSIFQMKSPSLLPDIVHELETVDHAEEALDREVDCDDNVIPVVTSTRMNPRLSLSEMRDRINPTDSRARKIAKLRKGNGETVRGVPPPDPEVREDILATVQMGLDQDGVVPPHFDPEFAEDFKQFD